MGMSLKRKGRSKWKKYRTNKDNSYNMSVGIINVIWSCLYSSYKPSLSMLFTNRIF